MNNQEKSLFERFQFFGRKHLEYRQKCIGLLPEIYRQKIHIKKGFDSIFEFAAKFAGLSNEQVRRVLSLEEKFNDKPILKSLLENGEVSLSKLARVASVATAYNEEFWAAQVKLLPKSALETLIKDDQKKTDLQNQQESIKTENGLQQALIVLNFVPGHKLEELGLNMEVTEKLIELKRKGLDINAIILESLEKRDLEIVQEKEEISADVNAKKAKNAASVKKQKPSRYVPIKVKNILSKEYGTKCAIYTCNKPSAPRHHADRFGIAGINDPKYMAPLCADHHKIAHSIDITYQEIRAKALR